ncbi:LysE family transporter [Devosia sp. A8/3-2]|nr:LysE family transporter [Devosia sp. A8/3-2]
MLVVAGIATGCSARALLTALGLGALFAAYPMLLTVLKFAGGFYLLYLGIRALWSMRKGRGLVIAAGTGRLSDLAAWRRGFVVVMTNPKAALMWSAIATFLLGAGLSRWEVLAFGPIVAITALTIYGTYALLFSTGMATSVYDRFARIIRGRVRLGLWRPGWSAGLVRVTRFAQLKAPGAGGSTRPLLNG